MCVCVGEAGGGDTQSGWLTADKQWKTAAATLKRQTHLQILQPGFQLRFSDWVAENRLQPASVRPEGNRINRRNRKRL